MINWCFILSIYVMYMYVFCEEMCQGTSRRYPWQHHNYCICYRCYLILSTLFYRNAVSVNITLCNAIIALIKMMMYFPCISVFKRIYLFITH